MRNLVGKSTSSYIYTFEETRYHKLVTPPDQLLVNWLRRLIVLVGQKVDSKVWLRKLGRLGRSNNKWLMKGQSRDKLWYEIISIGLDLVYEQSYDLIILYFYFV